MDASATRPCRSTAAEAARFSERRASTRSVPPTPMGSHEAATRTSVSAPSTFRAEEREQVCASRKADEAQRNERLEQFRRGHVPKSRFERQCEADAQRRARDAHEAHTAYLAVLEDLGTSETQRPGVLGARFVTRDGVAYVPPHRAAPKRDAQAAFEEKASVEPRKTGRGGMAAFLSELQQYVYGTSRRNQAARAAEGLGTSLDPAQDTSTTNLCVRGLDRSVTEHALGDYFARWGDVGTVKLLPRGDTGFVAYMRRDEAVRALHGADGLAWGPSVLLLSWARAVPLPSQPQFARHAAPRRLERATSPMPVRHRTERPALPDAVNMADEGYMSPYSTDSEEGEEAASLRPTLGAPLSRLAQRRLHALLSSLIPRRERIAQCMALALDHAYAAEAVAAQLVQSLLVPSTPIPRKVARLYVVSDILHNSAAPVPHAWRYRDAFSPHLPHVFAHFRDVVRAFPGRVKAEAVEHQIVTVLDCWDAWLVYPPAVLNEFRDILQGRL